MNCQLAHIEAWLEYISCQCEGILEAVNASGIPPELARKLESLKASRKSLAAALAASATPSTGAGAES